MAANKFIMHKIPFFISFHAHDNKFHLNKASSCNDNFIHELFIEVEIDGERE